MQDNEELDSTDQYKSIEIYSGSEQLKGFGSIEVVHNDIQKLLKQWLEK